MARKSLLFVLLITFAFFSFASAQHASTDSDSKIAQYVKLASELASRARANIYFTNLQDIFRGVQFNYVNVGLGNLTFLRRDMVASGRIPIVLARVYDSSAAGSADFGPGWMLSAAETISIQDHTAKVLSESGSVIEFIEAAGGIFTLAKDRPSDYLQIRKTTTGAIQLQLRTGFVKEFKLLGESYRLAKVTDRNGNEVGLVYKDGSLFRVENASHFIELKRDGRGKIISAQDDQGRKTSYRYDAKGRLMEGDDLGGATWLYAYTDGNQLKTARDPMKRLNFEVSYDDAGRVRRIKQPSGMIQFSYDRSNQSTAVFDRKELVSRYFQNEEGVTTRIVNPLGEETAIRLDGSRNVVSLSRNGSIVQSMEYDSEHRIIRRRAVAGSMDVSYKYDPATGALTGIDSGRGPARTFGYDGNGNLSSAATDDGLHRYGFSASGDLTTYSAQNLELSFAPDSDGLIASLKETKATQETQATQDATSLGYKTGGELSEVNFSDGRKAKYEYQPSGLRAKLVYKDGRHTEYDYDPAGNLISTRIFDEKGKQVQGQKLTLNDSYQVIKRALFDGTEEGFEYDPNGNLTKHTKNGAVTRFEYDELNRLVAVLTPTGERLTYTYTSGERSIVEQYEHSSTSVADLIDSGFTFATAFQVMATRPLAAPFGTIRFSEGLGTFQLANASGNEIITPESTIEQALQKLSLVDHKTALKSRQNLFNRPFNTIFMPAEYATINCCFSCSDGAQCRIGLTDGGDTTGCCPPCDPPPPGGIPPDPPPPPTLACTPATVTRGQNVACSVSASGSATYSGWTFTDGTNTVSSNLSSSSWSGTMITSGTIKVNVSVQGGAAVPLSANVTVNPRTSFAFASAPASEQTVRNTIACATETHTLNSPPQSGSAGDAFGVFCLDQSSGFNFSGITDNGPNNGYGYVTQVSNQFGGVGTAFKFVVVSDLRTSSSQFYHAQCGNYNAQTNPNGFISGAQLATNTYDHESGPVLSHWMNYGTSQNDPSNNLGLVMEKQIAPPGVTGAQFTNQINAAVTNARNTIVAAAETEPCGGDVRKDSSQACNFFGNINFNNQSCQ